MAQFGKKKAVIEATQWHRNGDHPLDDVWRVFEDTGLKPTEPREGKIVRYFRHPAEEYAGTKLCPECGRTYHDHGFIDDPGGTKVCPGDFVVTGEDDSRIRYYTIKPKVMEEHWYQLPVNDLPVLQFFGKHGSMILIPQGTDRENRYMSLPKDFWIKATDDFKAEVLLVLPQELTEAITELDEARKSGNLAEGRMPPNLNELENGKDE